MRTLTEIADSFQWDDGKGNGIDKGTTRNAGHSYTYFYDKLFSPLRDCSLPFSSNVQKLTL